MPNSAACICTHQYLKQALILFWKQSIKNKQLNLLKTWFNGLLHWRYLTTNYLSWTMQWNSARMAIKAWSLHYEAIKIYQLKVFNSIQVPRTVVEPMANATKLVMDVTVMDTPACFKVRATLMGSSSCFSAAVRLFHASIITNISSTPRPARAVGNQSSGNQLSIHYN